MPFWNVRRSLTLVGAGWLAMQVSEVLVGDLLYVSLLLSVLWVLQYSISRKSFHLYTALPSLAP